MARIFRHDAITLHQEAKEADFISFIEGKLLPHFSKQYKGPTRTSKADLKGQSFLQDTKGRRKYLWVTIWEGSSEAVRGAAFENTRMIRFAATDAVLKKLEAFGKRTTEKIFSELANLEVPTNI